MKALAILFCFLVVVAKGQTDTLSGKRLRITPLPVIYYSPETRFGFGALVAGSFETVRVPDSLTRTSYAQTYFLYTVNKQYEWGNKARIYGPQNRYIFFGRFNYTYFPEFYYGIATEDPESRKDTIEYNRSQLDLQYYWRIKKSLYAGVASRYNRIANVSAGGSGHFYEDLPLGHEGYWLLGFAPALTIETRDDFIYPRKGFFLETLLYLYPRWGGNSYGMTGLTIDARKYFPLEWISKFDVLAVQVLINSYGGDVPFKDMADIGGPNTMRGYYTGFYRYRNLYAFQAEFRTHLFWRVGITIWAGAALTPEKWYDLFDNSLKPNAGLGLRLMMNRKDRLNVRLDQGFGKLQQKGFYLDISEAF